VEEPDEQLSTDIVSLLGIPFLAYVLNSSVEDVGAHIDERQSLAPKTSEALAGVLAHALELAGDAPFGNSPASPDGSPSARMRRFGWTDIDRATTHANLFRLACGGELPKLPDGLDPVEEAAAEIAVDYFPITLLPTDPDHPLPQKPMIARARVEALEAALATDPLAELLAPGVTFYTSTGMGYGPLWPFRVAECALVTAEQRTRMLGNKSPETYIEAVASNIRLMRELCVTGIAEVPAVVGFWNVEMWKETELAGPRGGKLRAATEADPQVPMAARATMALDTVCQVGFSKGANPPSSGPFFAGAERLRIDEQLVCLAGLLSTANDGERAMPMVAWTQVFDPYQPYVGSFEAERLGPPTILFPAARLQAMEEWLLRLDTHYDKSIRVAIMRTVSAFAEGGPWDDELIDFVIALENLFGGPGRSLERRISTALAIVVGGTEEQSAAIAAASRRVYQARSALVHGDELPDAEDHPREDAERLVLDAWRSLLTRYAELIPDRKARRRLWKKKAAQD
jgi:hypothetical protein